MPIAPSLTAKFVPIAFWCSGLRILYVPCSFSSFPYIWLCWSYYMGQNEKALRLIPSFLFSGDIAWVALVGSRKQLFTQTEILIPFFFEQTMTYLLIEIVASYCLEVHINKMLKQVRLFSVPLWLILEASTSIQVTCLLHPVSPRSLFQ